MNEIDGEGKIVAIDYHETFQVNVIRYDTKKRYVLYSQLDEYTIGDVLILRGNVQEFENKTRPFGFDEKNYYLGHHIHGQIIVEQVSLKTNQWHIQTFRYELMNSIQQLKSSPVIQALWFGENSDLDRQLLSSLNILFLFKVTGLHIYTLLRLLKRWFINNERIYQWVYILILLMFWYLHEWHYTMFRYILLWLIYQSLKYLNININPVIVVLFSLIIHLFISPYLIYNMGFIFGYTIVIFIRVLRDVIHLKGLKFYFILSIHVSLLINIWSNEMNLLSIVLTPVFVFLVSVVVFLGSLVVWFIPVFDHFFYEIYQWITIVIEQFSHINKIIFFPNLLGIFQWLSVLSMLWILISKSYKQLIIRAYSLLIILTLSFVSVRIDNTNTFFMLDVGQGDAFIVDSRGCLAVVDAFEGVTETLKGLGKNTIDYLFLTHNDLDHTKEKNDLIDQFKVKKMYTAPFQTIDGFKPLKRFQKFNCGDVLIQSFVINKDLGSDNANSLVLKLSINAIDFLLMGDATIASENELILKYGDMLRSEFLKIGHHGSKTSTSLAFLNHVQPTYALISVGRNNHYGMPHESVIETLEHKTIFIYRTDTMGTIQIEIRDNDMKIKTYEP